MGGANRAGVRHGRRLRLPCESDSAIPARRRCPRRSDQRPARTPARARAVRRRGPALGSRGHRASGPPEGHLGEHDVATRGVRRLARCSPSRRGHRRRRQPRLLGTANRPWSTSPAVRRSLDLSDGRGDDDADRPLYLRVAVGSSPHGRLGVHGAELVRRRFPGREVRGHPCWARHPPRPHASARYP